MIFNGAKGTINYHFVNNKPIAETLTKKPAAFLGVAGTKQ